MNFNEVSPELVGLGIGAVVLFCVVVALIVRATRRKPAPIAVDTTQEEKGEALSELIEQLGALNTRLEDLIAYLAEQKGCIEVSPVFIEKQPIPDKPEEPVKIRKPRRKRNKRARKATTEA